MMLGLVMLGFMMLGLMMLGMLGLMMRCLMMLGLMMSGLMMSSIMMLALVMHCLVMLGMLGLVMLGVVMFGIVMLGIVMLGIVMLGMLGVVMLGIVMLGMLGVVMGGLMMLGVMMLGLMMRSLMMLGLMMMLHNKVCQSPVDHVFLQLSLSCLPLKQVPEDSVGHHMVLRFIVCQNLEMYTHFVTERRKWAVVDNEFLNVLPEAWFYLPFCNLNRIPLPIALPHWFVVVEIRMNHVLLHLSHVHQGTKFVHDFVVSR